MSESKSRSRRRLLPGRASVVIGRLNPTAFGIAVGAVLGIALALATAVLAIRGGEVVGPHLSLLGNYLPGYTVSWLGVTVGLLYGLMAGFLAGFAFATLRNIAVVLYLRWIWTRFQHHAANDLLDRLS